MRGTVTHGPPQMPIVLGVDVGVVHLALATGHVDAQFRHLVIAHVEVINTMVHAHEAVPLAACTLHHTGMAADRVAHVVQERKALFQDAHTIVVERQPPGGLRDVEQVLVILFRDKTVVMAPQTMHAHIGSSGRPYALRKLMAIEFAAKWVPDLLDRFPVKADDAADAVSLVATFVQKHADRLEAASALERAAVEARSKGLDLDAFRYRGSLGKR